MAPFPPLHARVSAFYGIFIRLYPRSSSNLQILYLRFYYFINGFIYRSTSAYLPISLSIRLSILSVYTVCLSVYLSGYLSYVCLSVYLSICLSAFLSIWLFVHLSIWFHLSGFYLSVYLSVCLFRLSVYLSPCLTLPHFGNTTHYHSLLPISFIFFLFL